VAFILRKPSPGKSSPNGPDEAGRQNIAGEAVSAEQDPSILWVKATQAWKTSQQTKQRGPGLPPVPDSDLNCRSLLGKGRYVAVAVCGRTSRAR